MAHQARPRHEVPLTGGVTRSYTRVERGRAQRVNQYPTPHPRHGGPPLATQHGAKGINWGKIPTHQEAWDMIKPGMILDFGGEPWKVLHQGVAAPGKPNSSGTSSGRNTGSKGKGVNTKGGGSTGSAGKGVNTKGGSKGANKGKTSLSGPVTNVLENLWSGKKIQMTLHGNFKVLVY